MSFYFDQEYFLEYQKGKSILYNQQLNHNMWLQPKQTMTKILGHHHRRTKHISVKNHFIRKIDKYKR